jgi:hypothetical protein
VDQVIAALAELQHGVVAYRQLIALGVTRDEIEHHAGCGRLHRIHRGVYAVGHVALTQKARWMAAVLAAGPGAVLSHRSAAALWELRKQWRGPIEVTVPKHRRAPRGVRLRRSALPEDERTTCDNIPVTTPNRTALDLAAELLPQQTERLINEIGYRHLVDPLPLAALLHRYPRRRGTPAIRAALGKKALPTETDMEADYLAFCDEFDIPRPDATQRRQSVHGRVTRADCVYEQPRILVELDGGSHRTDERFNSDRARDRANLVRGWRTIRVTVRHLRYERAELAADLAALLVLRGASGPAI